MWLFLPEESYSLVICKGIADESTHCRCVTATVNGRPIPGNIVCTEKQRHRLSWISF